jgi:phage baseplate assembly protein gpV
MLGHMILALAFLVASTTAFAHGTGQHVLGTVTAIDESHMEIRTTKGATVSVQLNKQTRFKSKRKPRSTEPPSVGDRVVVEATKDEETLTAIEVHYAAASRVPQAAPELTPASPSDQPKPAQTQ